jgi:L-lysine 2,3-aminomutase
MEVLVVKPCTQTCIVMPTRGTALLREALLAGEVGCDVKLHSNQAGEITVVEASGDEVKLVPLRRMAEDIKNRIGGR